jgi:hypothetical protein
MTTHNRVWFDEVKAEAEIEKHGYRATNGLKPAVLRELAEPR